MRSPSRALIWRATAIGVLAFVARRATAQALTPGTYRVVLCAQPCTIADSGRAIGVATIVIVGDSTAERDSIAAVPRSLRALGRAGTGGVHNACINITRAERRVAGEELFFGIYLTGATRWQYSAAAGFSLLVFSSPDASYTLRWTAPGRLREGEGWSSG
jgi:hypothetical protein